MPAHIMPYKEAIEGHKPFKNKNFIFDIMYYLYLLGYVMMVVMKTI